MNIMKRLLNTMTAIFALCTSLVAQPQQGIEALAQAFEKFLSSNEVLTKSTGWSNGMNEYHFKYTMPDNGQPIRLAALEQLAAAFDQNALSSSALYSYNHDKDEPPFRRVTFSRKDNYFLGITGNYGLEDNENFRIINFVIDGELTSFGLLWHEMQFHDRNGKPFRTIDGRMFKFFDGIWKMEKFSQNFAKRGSERWTIPVIQDENVRYDILKSQLTNLCNGYVESKKRGEEKTCDAIAYSIRKLCTEYKGMLSQQQFEEIRDEIGKAFFLAGEQDQVNSDRSITVGRGLWELENRTEKPLQGRTTYTLDIDDDNIFVKPDNYRLLWMDFDAGNDNCPQVKVSLTGTASTNSSTITIKRIYPEQNPYSINVTNGKFTYNGSFNKDQLLEIEDQQGNKMIVIADDTPTEIDLLKQTLRGSRQNERFAESQRRLKALEPEFHEYATCVRGYGAPYWTVVDDEGYNRLMDDAHHLQLQMMAENKDNMIPVWYLTQNYFMMTADELAPFMQPSLPYANHISLQPVRKYYENMQKRAVGGQFTDLAAVDTAGVRHQLSEYIGQGKYTILGFWNMSSRWDMKTLKALQRAYKDANLNIVCVTMDQDRKQWAEYVRKRDLNMIHLQPTDLADNDRTWECDIFKAYGITTLPETVIFSPDGRIIANGLCGESLKAFINQLNL